MAEQPPIHTVRRWRIVAGWRNHRMRGALVGQRGDPRPARRRTRHQNPDFPVKWEVDAWPARVGVPNSDLRIKDPDVLGSARRRPSREFRMVLLESIPECRDLSRIGDAAGALGGDHEPDAAGFSDDSLWGSRIQGRMPPGCVRLARRVHGHRDRAPDGDRNHACVVGGYDQRYGAPVRVRDAGSPVRHRKRATKVRRTFPDGVGGLVQLVMQLAHGYVQVARGVFRWDFDRDQCAGRSVEPKREVALVP